MKKLLFVAAVAAISFASCKKDTTCTCTRTDADTAPGYTAPPAETTVTTNKGVKKTDAALWCGSTTNTNPYVVGTTTYTHTTTETCTLK